FMEWATDRIGEQYPRIVREREANTFQETIEGIRKSIRVYGIHGVPKLLKDVYTSVSTQNPSSINEFLHALTRIYR
ncbi:hypothetical protein KJ780_01510, partial [Candidatus Micrarchaeota archaeon]|nr:hypothetical protein [Candidatus Micrarchaeota archaeon]